MCSWNEYKSKVDMDTGYAILMFTDKLMMDNYPLTSANDSYLSEHFDLLLDMRVFNEYEEWRLFRGDAGSEFAESRLCDYNQDGNALDIIEDEQCLDVDLKKTVGNTIVTTGGGSYIAPFEGYETMKTIIKNYIAYDSNGQAYVTNWRLAGFKPNKRGACE